MSTALNDVYSAALALSDLDRDELTARLLAEDRLDLSSQEEWEKEIERRVSEITSCQADKIPWEKVQEMMWNETPWSTPLVLMPVPIKNYDKLFAGMRYAALLRQFDLHSLFRNRSTESARFQNHFLRI